MSLSRFTPKKYLCRYPLSRGVLINAILLAIVAVISIIVLAIEMITFNSCLPSEKNGKIRSRRIFDIIQGIVKCVKRLVRNSLAFNGTAIIYCIVLLIFQLWVIWAVKKGKSSVVLLWVVVTSIWLVQMFCLFVVFLIMYLNDMTVLEWSLCAAFGLFGFCSAAYGVAVGLGLWLEMKALAGDTA